MALLFLLWRTWKKSHWVAEQKRVMRNAQKAFGAVAEALEARAEARKAGTQTDAADFTLKKMCILISRKRYAKAGMFAERAEKEYQKAKKAWLNKRLARLIEH